MTRFWNRITGRRRHLYERLPLNGDQLSSPLQATRSSPSTTAWTKAIIVTAGAFLVFVFFRAYSAVVDPLCDSIDHGYRCSPHISQFWGQYSLYFSVPSEIPPEVPKSCSITFAQILSRHGGRDPTAGKTIWYNYTINKIQQNVQSYSSDAAFLKKFKYNLGADQLTIAGAQQMVNSGIRFYRYYESLASQNVPFVRSSGQTRVIMSAQKWLEGFGEAKGDEKPSSKMVIISEDTGSNNTLSHGLCTKFEKGAASIVGTAAQNAWADIFVPSIQSRINNKLVGANLTQQETIFLMDLCPFETVAHPTAEISEFCGLFSRKEWHQYDYYQSLGKYYGFADGNPLGATQGVGFVNELIARMTGTPVQDETCTNHTLDSDSETFPLDRRLYADFSHDNDMTSIFSAFGLYNSTYPLSNTTLENIRDTNGYSASWTVPFAARAYFEKMKCDDEEEEFVRVIVNDRVIPLKYCGADKQGRCKLSKFVDSMSFSQSGGHWNQCFV
ncbi:phosphoglycerate mutase-like protein [Lepidopterella palustris CBS 459.81]|uniref:Phytase A n=1 Tax=Lepidopterella palustris CBS 459.81 TaxID=1314670 RepID=A0A8E2E3A6_9PEZI|nr:phosphoglycerate mutase-like protein [Lepidopterella palustris CBS 459.81]